MFIRLLKILPKEEKHILVRDHVDVWFTKVIPMTVELAVAEGPQLNDYVEAAEMLTEELVHFQYEDDPTWYSLFTNIHRPDK